MFKEGEPGVVNGNIEHSNLDNLKELSNSNSSIDQDAAEVKPKLREWEKHKAPWLEEMKLNQAKRTSTSPGPEQNKLKLTPTEKTEATEDVKTPKTSPFEKEASIGDGGKPSIGGRLKTPTPTSDGDRTPSPVILRYVPIKLFCYLH